MKKNKNNEQEVVRNEQDQFEHLNYMSGCEVCNIGIIKEIDKRVEDGETVNKITKSMEDDITNASGGVKLFTAGSIRSRYNRIKNPKSCTQRTTNKRTSKVVRSVQPEQLITPKVQDDIDKLKETCSNLRAKNIQQAKDFEKEKTQLTMLMATRESELMEQIVILQTQLNEIPVVKSEQEQRDEFINKARKDKEEKAIAERKYFGVNEDGTPI